MNLGDYETLTWKAYEAWQQCLDEYEELATQIAGGASVPRNSLTILKTRAGRALADLMAIQDKSLDDSLLNALSKQGIVPAERQGSTTPAIGQ